MSNPKLVSIVRSVINHPGIAKINFRINGQLVTGQRLRQVLSAIEQGRISCEAVNKFNLSPGQNMAPGNVMLALYDVDKDTIQFPREDYGMTNGFEKTVIVHETTHAIFDLFAKSTDDRVLGIDDESAAVMAQACYIRFCEVDDAIRRFTMMIDGPGELALKLVDKMIAQTERFHYTGIYDFSYQPGFEKFRQAVAQEWNLIKEVFPDGTFSDRTNVQTIYNGVLCSSCKK